VPQRFLFPEKQKVVLEDFELDAPGPTQLQIYITYSQMSIGTENTVFNANYEPDSHWASFGAFPFVPGYTVVGIVDKVGDAVTGFAPGDRIMTRASHATHANVEAARAFRVPDDVDDRLVPWGKLAQIAFTAARRAQFSYGEDVLVVGAGPIGQMALRWAVVAGVRHVVVCDPVPQRRALALSGGATHVISSTVQEATDEIIDASGGQLPGTVVDTTGVAGLFPYVLQLTRTLGKTVLLGDTGSPTQQHLTRDVVTRSLTIYGIHHTHGLFEEGETYDLFFDLVERGRFDMADMNTHVFTPDRVVDAYALANTHRDETMGILFDWRSNHDS